MSTAFGADSVSPSFSSSSKRHACDRCRKNKLRCPPRDNASQPCRRCLGIGSLCTTTYQGRKGAATAANTGGQGAGPIRPRIKTSPSSQIAPPSGAMPTFLSTTSGPSTVAQGLPWPSAPDNSLDLPFDLPDDLFRDHALSLLSSELGEFEDTRSPKGWHPQVDSDDNELTSHGAPSLSISTGAPGIFPHAESSTLTTGAEFDLDPSSTVKDAQLSAGECSSRLCRLRLALGNALGQCPGEDGNFWNGVTSELRSSGLGARGAVEQDTAQNPFGEVLRNSSELLSIIQSFTQPERETSGTTSSSGRSVKPPSQNTTMDLVMILDIISAYVQILAIYDSLFQRLYTTLRGQGGGDVPGGAAAAVPQLQMLPGLQLAGFSVRQGNLQTKILMEAMLYHIEMLEKVLLLPGDLRVCSHRGEGSSSGGLLGRDQRTQSLVNGFLASSTLFLEEAVTRLRANIDKVKRLLDI